MVFGSIQKLQGDVFCLTEERDYFQGKFLEQVSEIAALKDELNQSKKEISKLRNEMMSSSQFDLSVEGDAKPAKDDDNSTLTTEDGVGRLDNEDKEDNEDDDDVDDSTHIRKSAEKLLQWASYRSSVRASSTPDHSTVNTPNSQRSASLGGVPRVIQSSSVVKDVEDNDDDVETVSTAPPSEATSRARQLYDKFEDVVTNL